MVCSTNVGVVLKRLLIEAEIASESIVKISLS